MARQGLRVPYSDERFLEMLDQVDKKTLYPDASHEEHGLMSATDKEKLDGIEAGAEPNAPNTVIDADYVHTDNNYTNEDKTKLAGIESGAQANVLEKIRVNAVPQTVTDKGVNIEVPEKTSELVNDAGFVAYTTRALVNYHLKSETYSKAEVQALIAAIQGISVRSVNVLPEASAATKNIIFLVPSANPQMSNVKDEFITIDVEGGGYGWEQIGSTAIDLSGYVTDAELTTALASYTTTADLTTLLSAKYEKPSDGIPSSDMSEAVRTSLGKADTALQSFTETDPTVPAWAKAANPPAEIFWAKFGVTTAAELDAAVSAGKAVICRDGNYSYCYGGKDTGYHYFFAVVANIFYRRLAVAISNNSWSRHEFEVAREADKAQDIIGNESNTAKFPSTKAVADYVASKAEVFVVEYGVTSGSDVVAAYDAGKTVVCFYNNRVYTISTRNQSICYFGSTDNETLHYLYVLLSSNTWGRGSTLVQRVANKVNSWQETPSDLNYPSEKLVKDSLDAKADKVSSPTADDLAKLDANGNLADSGLTPNMLSLFLDMDKLTPVQTIEYDVARNGWMILLERVNPTGTEGKDVVGNIACRITTTGADMTAPQIVDLVVFMPAKADLPFPAFILPRTPETAADKRGIQYMREIYPKAIASGYNWQIEFKLSTANTRHLKIEVFKTAEGVAFCTEQTNSNVNGTYQVAYSTFEADRLRALYSVDINIQGNSTAAAYLNGYLNSFLSVCPATTGEAFTINDICYFSTDNKLYKASTTNVPVFPDSGIHSIGYARNANVNISFAYLRQRTVIQASQPTVSHGTFTRGEEIYLRCHISNGVLYSDGILTNAVAPGYTWVSIGKVDSATQLALDTVGKSFFTLDANGKLTHINGREIAGGSGSAAAWGSIIGTLSDQTDLANTLAGKQPTIDASHKLDYSLLSNTPTIPAVEALTTAEIDTIWSSN